MSYRRFCDEAGAEWEVWEVQPSAFERRSDVGSYDGGDRRRASRLRAPIASELRLGWIAFQSRGVRRRLAPIPHDWSRLADADLLELLGRSEVIEPAGRPMLVQTPLSDELHSGVGA